MYETQPTQNVDLSAWELNEFDIRVLYVACDHLLPGAWDKSQLSNYQWRLYHNSASGANLFVDEESYVLQSDRLYIIPPNLKLGCRNNVLIDQTYVHFDLASTFSMAFQKLFPKPLEISFTPVLKTMTEALRNRLQTSSQNDIVTGCLSKALVFQTFGEKLDRLFKDSPHQCIEFMSDMKPILPALKLCDLSPERTIENKELSEKCLMSEDYFIHVFKQLIGVPPRKYQLKRRLTLAAQLLLYTSSSIDEIAEKLFFNDRFYFTRAFTKETGHSPGEFRKGARK
jgi:AraC-like DNA-binding protein